MSNFLKLIKDIQAPLLEIGQKELSENLISQEVSKILTIANVHKEFDEHEFLQNLIKSDIQSYYPAGSFSDFHCLLEENDFFRTELYFWDGRDTGIHSHPFLGSFQCLKGSLVAIDFDFKASDSIKGSREISLGELKITNKLKMSVGDVYPILQGTDHIHKTMHLGPTINLCIRSRTEKSLPNYSFLYPGMRIEKKPLNSQEERWLELYGYLSRREDNEELLQKTFEKLDLPALIYLAFVGKKIMAPFMNQHSIDSFYKKCLKKINQTHPWDQFEKMTLENEKFIEKLNFAYKA
jgi:hypothetical protein